MKDKSQPSKTASSSGKTTNPTTSGTKTTSSTGSSANPASKTTKTESSADRKDQKRK